jgi:hypothetical protein
MDPNELYKHAFKWGQALLRRDAESAQTYFVQGAQSQPGGLFKMLPADSTRFTHVQVFGIEQSATTSDSYLVYVHLEGDDDQQFDIESEWVEDAGHHKIISVRRPPGPTIRRRPQPFPESPDDREVPPSTAYPG